MQWEETSAMPSEVAAVLGGGEQTLCRASGTTTADGGPQEICKLVMAK